MKHLEHFHELKSLTRKQKFFLLSLLPVYFMVIGLFLQPIPGNRSGESCV